ncbi:hypothetical protein Q5752_002207 [Cryptotrichosporon argae]
MSAYPESLTGVLALPDGASLTPWHLAALGGAMLSLLVAPEWLPPDARPWLGAVRRGMVLLVLAVLVYSVAAVQLARRLAPAPIAWDKKQAARLDRLLKEIEVAPLPSEWDDATGHPSRFLTTPHGRPRLFPFPLGKAKGATKELWWEAGNAAHVGHFNRADSADERRKVEDAMLAREAARVKAAKKAKEAYEAQREKWAARLAHIKAVCGIVVLGLFYRPAAAVALAALIYYTLATRLHALLEPKPKELKEPPARRPKVKVEPGMAMAYLYEPTAGGDVDALAAVPVRAGMSRLISSTDRRYAS